jgi:hypothetical protein
MKTPSETSPVAEARFTIHAAEEPQTLARNFFARGTELYLRETPPGPEDPATRVHQRFVIGAYDTGDCFTVVVTIEESQAPGGPWEVAQTHALEVHVDRDDALESAVEHAKRSRQAVQIARAGAAEKTIP